MRSMHKYRLSQCDAKRIVAHRTNDLGMAMNNTIVDIAEGAAASVYVRVGTTIRVARGKVWLTQEGDSRDYCVCPGITFCADRKGRVVLGAVGGPVVAVV